MVEWIGFIISLLAMLYLFISQNSGQKRGRFPDEQSEEEMQEEDPLKNLIREIENEGKKNEYRRHEPIPPPKKEKALAKKAHVVPKKREGIQQRQLKSTLEERRLKPTDLTDLDERRLSSSLLSREEWARLYAIEDISHAHHDGLIRKPSRARKILGKLGHPRDLVVYHEIMSKPLGLRSEKL